MPTSASSAPRSTRTAEPQHSQSGPLAVAQLGFFCNASGCALQLWAARHSQGAAQPQAAHPQPRLLERAPSKVADATAFSSSSSIYQIPNTEHMAYRLVRTLVPLALQAPRTPRGPINIQEWSY